MLCRRDHCFSSKMERHPMHASAPLIRSAIANDVILLCLPPKTTHITQPLDVAVYRKMKIESAKIMSQAKLVKSNLWVAKKAVSGIFKLIYEKSFTMSSIIGGFRKCGISPFNPNAIDKNLLLRSCDEINADKIDLAEDPVFEEENVSESSHRQVVESTNADLANDKSFGSVEMTYEDSENTTLLGDISFVVGEDGILTLDVPDSNNNTTEADIIAISTVVVDTSECPPELALAAVENAMTPRKKRKYKEYLQYDVDLPGDILFTKWKSLIFQTSVPFDEMYTATKLTNYRTASSSASTPNSKQSLQEVDGNAAQSQVDGYAAKSQVDGNEVKSQVDGNEAKSLVGENAAKQHPLVNAGLISQDLVDVFFVPSADKRENKGTKRSRVLTSQEVMLELEEKEKRKKKKMR